MKFAPESLNFLIWRPLRKSTRPLSIVFPPRRRRHRRRISFQLFFFSWSEIDRRQQQFSIWHFDRCYCRCWHFVIKGDLPNWKQQLRITFDTCLCKLVEFEVNVSRPMRGCDEIRYFRYYYEKTWFQLALFLSASISRRSKFHFY